VVVAVVPVRMVEMLVYEVVEVVSMRHLLVTAARSVRVCGLVLTAVVRRRAVRRVGVGHLEDVLVDVVVVIVVQMPVVQVVDVVLVLDRGVPAAGAVQMFVSLVDGVLRSIHARTIGSTSTDWQADGDEKHPHQIAVQARQVNQRRRAAVPRCPIIRTASPDERSGVVATVVSAFAEDPGWAFIFGEEYERLTGHFVEALFDLRVASHNIWVTDDLAATAMWESPGTSDAAPADAESIWARYRAIAGADAFGRLTGYHEAVTAVRPAEPHWYLGVLATDPQRQREGLATAVMAPIIERADRDGIACCLETSSEDNRRFYERRGFTQATEIILPGGPPTWWLRRPSQS
jgi:GNAT superfamily N-acetyltransferase